MNAQLHPAWFEHEPGTIPTPLQIVDALAMFAGKLEITAALLGATGTANLAGLNPEMLITVCNDLFERAKEVKALAAAIPIRKAEGEEGAGQH